MNTRLIIDKAAGVVLPEPLCEELHLREGDALELALSWL
jgi:antitoxin component of MazEF toxin-antitoxin module